MRGDRPLDAAASAGSGTAMLYVPPTGTVPAAVRNAATRIAPTAVHVVGSESALPASRLTGMLGMDWDRWTEPTPPR